MSDSLVVIAGVGWERPNDKGDENWLRSLVPSGTNRIRNIQNVGTSWEAVTLGDVAAGGIVQIRNLDSTNFVQLRQGSETALIRLEPQDFCQFRLDDAATLQAQADTSACELLVLAFDP